MTDDTALQTKYRPRKLDEVLGQDAVVRALRAVVAKRTTAAYLFSGPSGTGKTTLAGIVADMLGVGPRGVLSVNAATNTGIDKMREVLETLRYRSFASKSDSTGARAIIIDEAHRLSGQAWDSMLLPLEKPPAHVTWFLCTTALAKVPKTIKTRCVSLQLKPVGESDLRKLLDRVAREEGLRIERDVRDVIVRESEGSPRQMLSNLAVCAEASGRREASELLRSAAESDAMRDLCQFLIRGGSWQKATALLAKLEEEAPESVRIAVCNYLGGAARNAKSDREAGRLLAILSEFAEPYGAAERAMLTLSVGRVLLGE